jgi:DNA-binding Lrp family transcriptional regulator
MKSPPSSPRALDDLDRKIIARFQDDPRISNKSLALEFSVAEATVATRIRALQDSGVMRVVAQRDIRAQGYEFLAHIDVYVEGRAASEVAEDLAALDDVVMVATCAGSPQIIMQINAKSRQALAKVIAEGFAGIRGIRAIESSITLDIIKLTSKHTV